MSVLRKLAMKITGNSTETASQHHCEFGSRSDPCGASATRSVWTETEATDEGDVSVMTFDVCDRHYSVIQHSSIHEIKEERPLTANSSLSRQDVDRVKEEYREDTKDLPSRDEVREQYKEVIEDALRQFNRKVEEEGKSPEQAMQEIGMDSESSRVKSELNALLAETATIGHEGEWNEEFGKSDHTGTWYANVEFPDGHLDSETVDQTREAGWRIVNAYRYGDECLVVRFEKPEEMVE